MSGRRIDPLPDLLIGPTVRRGCVNSTQYDHCSVGATLMRRFGIAPLNERMALSIRLADGRRIGCVQIAGLVARRILCWVVPGRKLDAGERFGLIRLGSRVDIYLPEGVAPLVSVGQRAVAGETVLADLLSSEPQRIAMGQ